MHAYIVWATQYWRLSQMALKEPKQPARVSQGAKPSDLICPAYMRTGNSQLMAMGLRGRPCQVERDRDMQCRAIAASVRSMTRHGTAEHGRPSGHGELRNDESVAVRVKGWVRGNQGTDSARGERWGQSRKKKGAICSKRCPFVRRPRQAKLIRGRLLRGGAFKISRYQVREIHCGAYIHEPCRDRADGWGCEHGYPDFIQNAILGGWTAWGWQCADCSQHHIRRRGWGVEKQCHGIVQHGRFRLHHHQR